MNDWQQSLEDKIRKYLDGYSACHDFWHADRVRRYALQIAEKVACDHEILEAAALLHDVGYKDHDDDHKNHHLYGMKIAEEWLPQIGFPDHKVSNVVEAIRLHDDYHNGVNAETTDHAEVLIIQDADKIDTMGAVGIVRLAYYFGEKGYPIYNDVPAPETDEIWLNHSVPDQLRRDEMTKWDNLNFEYSREISRERNEFLKLFYDKLIRELLDHHGDKNGA